MKLLIISDVHSAWEQLGLAVKEGMASQCSILLFSGDAGAPLIYRYLETFDGEVHTVSGNNDVPNFEYGLYRAMHPKIIHHGNEMNMLFANTRMHMSHYPETAEEAAASGKFKVCIHGHTHRVRNEQTPNGTTILNPGELCGKRYGEATYMLFDTETGDVTTKIIPR